MAVFKSISLGQGTSAQRDYDIWLYDEEFDLWGGIKGYLDGSIQCCETLKNTHHSIVERFRHGDSWVYVKRPKGRDDRPWERILELFRPGEARRYADSMVRLEEMGFKGPKPISVVERRSLKVLVESYIFYWGVEGRHVTDLDSKLVGASLQQLHDLGWMRRDAIPRNFLVQEDAVVYIDFRLSSPLMFRKTRQGREKEQLIRHLPEAQSAMNLSHRESRLLRFFLWYKKATRGVKKFRRRHGVWIYSAILILMLVFFLSVK